MDEKSKSFFEKCKQPVDIEECRKALNKLISGDYTMHIPPQIDDADILISRALVELEELRKKVNHA